ncbi:hypothetical protein N9129_01865 [Akkermansiaceae bacterium]|nr:hypothetical protein [Akkermansiaceae bacterium]
MKPYFSYLTPLLLIAWGVSLISLYQGAHLIKAASAGIASLNPMSFGPQKNVPVPGLSAQEHLVLYGGSSKSNPEGRWKALHLSEPQNPSYYRKHLTEVDDIPEDFDEVRQRIDPDNGWFLIWEAGKLSKECVSKDSTRTRSKKEKEEKKAPHFIIEDPEVLKKIIQKLERAVSLPRFDNYTNSLTNEQMSLLPEAKDIVANYRNLTILATMDSSVLEWKYNTDAIRAALQEIQTRDEFNRLEKLALNLEKKHFSQVTSLIDGLISQALMAAHAGALYEASERLGLKEKASFYKDRKELFAARNEARKQRRKSNEHEEFNQLLLNHGSMLMNIATPAVIMVTENPPTLTKEQLRPGQRAERALFTRMITPLMFLIFSLLSLVIFFHRRGRENKPSFRPTLRLLLLGSLLPFVALVLFRYFLSFGMLDFGGRLLIFANYFLPDLASYFILLIVPLSLLRRDAKQKVPFYKNCSLLGFALLTLGFSSVMMHAPPKAVFPGGVVFVSLTAIWLVVFAIWKAFKKKPDPDYFARLAQLAPTYLLSATLIGLSSIGLAFEERYWFAQADIERPTDYHITLLEEQTTEALKEEIRQLAEFDE